MVDALALMGYTDVTVMDVSRIALERAKARLGARASRISWIAEDVTRWMPQRQWRVWHDRAVFHFLIDREEQDAYIEVMKQGTTKGSVVIIATFALTGPERCSGLPVQRYSASTLSARLGPDFRSERSDRCSSMPHLFGTTQEFMFAVFRRESIDHASRLTKRRRSAFPITETELRLIATAATTGLKSSPKAGYSAPAASGIPRVL